MVEIYFTTFLLQTQLNEIAVKPPPFVFLPSPIIVNPRPPPSSLFVPEVFFGQEDAVGVLVLTGDVVAAAQPGVELVDEPQDLLVPGNVLHGQGGGCIEKVLGKRAKTKGII